MDEVAAEQTMPPESDGWEWAVVEIFGHRRHAGRVREEERFGAKMLRIDVPVEGDPDNKGWQTHYYGGASIFSFSLSDEQSVLKSNKPYATPSRLTYRREEDETQDDGDGDEPF